ncbi:hypothetical protein BLS_001684 [Venturia inaequalis]|uniref:Uncharacterized protein n=1 Tax=Venturia inaequalis TaxID=5025 RepID=A0A8H3Z2X7_VENIN|nr:hypothetical protein EG328_011798 [Venturia inaequalis]KAE9984689.1 hypothetical protein BLS_001684 [Venturia inaequalis]RDI88988.1 hypothetical protein Vi05172_g1547 [Venturia inaequalis]
MVAKPNLPSEGDVISNLLEVRKAERQRLIASWLPAPTPEELASAKTKEELEQEEKEMFAPVPETLGVGAVPPKDEGDGFLRRKDTSSLEALKKMLVGKNAKPLPVKGSKQGPQSLLADRTTKPAADVDSDEEGGRTAAFTSRNLKAKAGNKKAKISQMPQAEKEADIDDEDENEDEQLKDRSSKTTAPAPSKRKATSFLDEILEGKKKKKKKRKNGQGETKA